MANLNELDVIDLEKWKKERLLQFKQEVETPVTNADIDKIRIEICALLAKKSNRTKTFKQFKLISETINNDKKI